MKTHLLLALIVLPLSQPLSAQTVDALELGGDGSFGCNGSSPGTLCDGTTAGAARLDFTLDTLSQTLTLVVENTSPDDGGPNPVMTEIFFNLPRQVTGIQILSQNAAGSGTPSFTLAFDGDLLDGDNPLSAPGGMGAFSALLDNGNGVQGAIANAQATSWGANPNHLVFGPVTFVFGLTGDLSDVDVTTFTRSLSINPPGDRTVNASAHFQGGGENGAFSGTISDNSGGCDPLYYVEGDPVIGGSVDLVVSGQKGCHGCILLSDGNTPTPITPKLTLDIGPTFLVALPVQFSTGGLHRLPVPILDSPVLVGQTFYTQWVAIDLIGSDHELSNVVDVTIQGK